MTPVYAFVNVSVLHGSLQLFQTEVKAVSLRINVCVRLCICDEVIVCVVLYVLLSISSGSLKLSHPKEWIGLQLFIH